MYSSCAHGNKAASNSYGEISTDNWNAWSSLLLCIAWVSDNCSSSVYNVNAPCIPAKHIDFRTWEQDGRHAAIDKKGKDSDEKYDAILRTCQPQLFSTEAVVSLHPPPSERSVYGPTGNRTFVLKKATFSEFSDTT